MKFERYPFNVYSLKFERYQFKGMDMVNDDKY